MDFKWTLLCIFLLPSCAGELINTDPPIYPGDDTGADVASMSDTSPDVVQQNTSDVSPSDVGVDEQPDAAQDQGATEDVAPTVDMGPDVVIPTGPQDAIDPAGITWLDPNISAWPITAELTVSFRGSEICLEYNKKNVWPAVGIFESNTQVVANAWAIGRVNNTWYASTFEWMRPGQTCKAANTVEPGHTKKPQLSGWTPQSGEQVYFIVSGLIRNPSYRNVTERTNIVSAVWP